MKQKFVQALRLVIDDRYIVILFGVFFALCIADVVFLAMKIHSSELQVVVHYTSFGATNFYRDKWYYLLSFIVFVVLLAIIHSMIIYKILQKRGRELAIAFLWLSMAIVLVALALFYQVLKIASLS